MKKIRIQLLKLEHRGNTYLRINLPKTSVAKNQIRKVSGLKWSQTHGCWYMGYYRTKGGNVSQI